MQAYAKQSHQRIYAHAKQSQTCKLCEIFVIHPSKIKREEDNLISFHYPFLGIQIQSCKVHENKKLKI
jgi:hypothetical protein